MTLKKYLKHFLQSKKQLSKVVNVKQEQKITSIFISNTANRTQSSEKQLKQLEYLINKLKTGMEYFC